ncbi:MAG: GNAT family N-acetyltransferase, partial [Cardiobacterium sp.]
MTWTIRPARAADLPAIVAIYNSTIESRASTADLAPVSVTSRQAWFDAHRDNRPLYVAEDADGTVCAWGSFSDYYPREAYRISAEISIYVAPEKRGRGLGAYEPGADFRLGDAVLVEIWGRRIKVP